MTKLNLKISGMTCGHCVQAVRRALESVPGVSVNEVGIGVADITFDESTTTAEQVQEAVADEGYAVTDAK